MLKPPGIAKHLCSKRSLNLDFNNSIFVFDVMWHRLVETTYQPMQLIEEIRLRHVSRDVSS